MLRDALELLGGSALAGAVEAILSASRIEFYDPSAPRSASRLTRTTASGAWACDEPEISSLGRRNARVYGTIGSLEALDALSPRVCASGCDHGIQASLQRQPVACDGGARF